MAGIRMGEDPRELVKPAEALLFLRDLAARYVEAKASKLAATTRIEYERMPRVYFDRPPIGKTPARDLTADDLERFLEGIASEAPIMANRLFQFVPAVCRRSANKGLLDHNPCAAVDRPRLESSRERVLSTDEIRALWQSLDEEQRPHVAAVVKMLLLLGQRSTETVEMRWQDVDLAARLWTIPGQYRKEGRLHVVPLSPLAVRTLLALPRDGERVFMGVYEANAQRDWWSAARARAAKVAAAETIPMEHFTKHDLRRTAMTGMTRLGITRFIAQRLIGHKEPGVGSTYDRYDYLREKTQAVQRWAKEIERMINGKRRAPAVGAIQASA